MVDMDQMTYAGETIDDYFANLGDKLQHIHFNDRAIPYREMRTSP